MGSRGVHRTKALAACCWLLGAAAVAAAACTGGGAAIAPSGPSATPAAAPSSTPLPTTTPAPDLLGPPPRAAEEVVPALSRFFAAVPGDGCPPRLKADWDAVCVQGDLDGDGKKDAAYLVPLVPGNGRGPAPAVVIVRRSALTTLETFEQAGTADAGGRGRAVFAVADLIGGGSAQLTFLATVCGASNCLTRLEVQSWDGTAWRPIGPGETFANPDLVKVEGKGPAARITVHAGALATVGAGPPRAASSTYELKQGRFQLSSSVPDRPVYLAHAIFDADARFDLGEWEGAIAAYRAAIADKKLLDWQKESGLGDGRQRLTAYALFRVALATAASGEDPRKAIDAVVLDAREPVFAFAAQEFRRGLLEHGGVEKGCATANVYLGTADIQEYLKDVFNYGYGNPRRTYRDVCPL